MKREDLRDSMKPIADVIGVDAVALLMKHFGGLTVRIPVTKDRAHLEELLRDNYGCMTIQQIAKRSGVSTRTIFYLLKQKASRRLPQT
jgi:hypothetical protein